LNSRQARQYSQFLLAGLTCRNRMRSPIRGKFSLVFGLP
jgi:hypothetical protein